MVIKTIIVSLISFSGLIFGIFLAFWTKEELKPGRRYFQIFMKLSILVMVVLMLLRPISNYLYSLIAFSLGIIISMFFRKNYFYLGIAVFSSSLYNNDFFSSILGLVFLIGLPFGTLIASNNLNNKNKLIVIALSNLIFFIIPVLLLFFKEFVININYLFFAFSSGALLLFLIKN